MLNRRALFNAMASATFLSSLQGRQALAQRDSGYFAMNVDRAFVRIKEGLVHYRHAGYFAEGEALPLYMMHASPGSSAGLDGLVAMLAEGRRVIAADTLGYGDSAAPIFEAPDLTYYADSVARILDALGIDKVDLYGSHTGANIAIEFVIAHPDRVSRLVFDGVALFDKVLAKDMLENYAPRVAPRDDGSHLLWAWNFLRDMGQFFPHYKRDPKHYLARPMQSAEQLTSRVIEVLKALPHYHKGYRAVFRHKTHQRLPLISVPTLCMAHKADPLHVSVEEAAALVPNCTRLVLPLTASLVDKVRAINDFLEV